MTLNECYVQEVTGSYVMSETKTSPVSVHRAVNIILIMSICFIVQRVYLSQHGKCTNNRVGLLDSHHRVCF